MAGSRPAIVPFLKTLYLIFHTQPLMPELSHIKPPIYPHEKHVLKTKLF